jgi:hypothetical protein
MDVRKLMRYKKLYKFFAYNRCNHVAYCNLRKKVSQLYGEYNFKKVIDLIINPKYFLFFLINHLI